MYPRTQSTLDGNEEQSFNKFLFQRQTSQLSNLMLTL